MKERIFMTDVNGTLTMARKPLSPEMTALLTELTDEYKLVVVTGAPWEDICGIMPDTLINHPNVDYWCNHGNVLYREGKEIYNTGTHIDIEMLKPLLDDVVYSCPDQYKIKYPCHYEVYGDCAINFTMLGRPEGGEPTLEERESYDMWDRVVHQRKWVVEFLGKILPEYDISVGGQISIDIVKKGFDKTQVVKHYKDDYRITYFGDRIKKYGNDNLIAHELADIGAAIYQVDNPEDTLMFMRAVLDIAAKEKEEQQ